MTAPPSPAFDVSNPVTVTGRSGIAASRVRRGPAEPCDHERVCASPADVAHSPRPLENRRDHIAHPDPSQPSFTVAGRRLRAAARRRVTGAVPAAGARRAAPAHAPTAAAGRRRASRHAREPAAARGGGVRRHRAAPGARGVRPTPAASRSCGRC